MNAPLLFAATFAAAAATITSTSIAHEFWIRPSSFHAKVGAPLDVHLVVGDGFPGEPVARNGPKIEKFSAFGGSGELPIPGVNGRDPAGSVTFDKPGVYVLAFRNIPSRIELDAVKFEEYLKTEGLDAVITKRAEAGDSSKPGREIYSRCAKSIVRVGDAAAEGFDRQAGLRFELTPLTDPASIAFDHPDTAGVFRVKAVFDGKPLAHATVSARTPHDPKFVVRVRTDEQGRAELKLTRGGMWLVSSVHMIAAPKDANADWESLWASVTFEVPAPAGTTRPAADSAPAAPSGGMMQTGPLGPLGGAHTNQAPPLAATVHAVHAAPSTGAGPFARLSRSPQAVASLFTPGETRHRLSHASHARVAPGAIPLTRK